MDDSVLKHQALGLWMQGQKHQGRADEAIEECKKAIAVDPTFGNPYNDIGSYLVNRGRLDEAIERLEKAKTAPRYEPRHFPYMNLGRIYAKKWMVRRAIRTLSHCLQARRGRDGVTGRNSSPRREQFFSD